MMEAAMPYAVFEDGERLTRVFATEEGAWKAAERAGLVETANGKKVLDGHLEIHACEPEGEGSDDAESDFILS
jgi:hypothetical protein